MLLSGGGNLRSHTGLRGPGLRLTPFATLLTFLISFLQTGPHKCVTGPEIATFMERLVCPQQLNELKLYPSPKNSGIPSLRANVVIIIHKGKYHAEDEATCPKSKPEAEPSATPGPVALLLPWLRMPQMARVLHCEAEPRICPQCLKPSFVVAVSFVLNTVRAHQGLGAVGSRESRCFSNATTMVTVVALNFTLVWSDVGHLLWLSHWLSE